MAYQTVKKGDCTQSISTDHGMTWERVWLDGNNSELRRKRAEPNILMTGDQVYVPDVETKKYDGETEKKHKFHTKGRPARLILRIKRNGKAINGKRYVLIIDGKAHEGETDDEGHIDIIIPPNAMDGQLLLNGGREKYDLILGGLDPLDETTGVQARLFNLGYAPGPIDGIMGPLTEAAVRKFQQQVGATVDSIVGPETRQHLENEYGC
ncbi:hypothetical protein DSCO28_65130 [Desulfosarcina ovata subsp. sediminis]|uniref:Peptidoglycan binding-like domain-containing protein n=1 Tax=Desulfosarcina ovata subsp. sediminis TaxID=885957 RepID=A0A5K8A0A6_9BACT|nr:peptidoglycan-binding domain-containing protein [Desulfosarcina ovata]BBO85947.1 hypothetical protein DSCO28_65130 [Desulfosarcina ovata subsp. sediminis]